MSEDQWIIETVDRETFFNHIEGKKIVGPYLGYTGDAEIAWKLDDGSVASFEVSYFEGCPTCGGTYEQTYMLHLPKRGRKS
jgi:hypothetical protein